MELVALVMLVCSVSNPNACTEERLLFESHGSLKECMWEAMPYMAQWSGNHPDVRVAKWHCEWPGAAGEKS